MAEKKNATPEPSTAEHGVTIAPCGAVAPNSGWLVDPKKSGQYTGDNAPWRR